jgi:hypothetical protein
MRFRQVAFDLTGVRRIADPLDHRRWLIQSSTRDGSI